MVVPFLDTNIFLRHLSGEPAEQAQRATAYLKQIEQGEKKVITTCAVLFEIVFTLERFYKKNKTEIRNLVLPLFELPGIKIEGKQSLKKIFTLYVDKNVSFIDAYHAVFMEKEKLNEVISFDHDFDKIEKLKRSEP